METTGQVIPAVELEKSAEKKIDPKIDPRGAAKQVYRIRNHAKHLQVAGVWAPIPIPGLSGIEVLVKAKETVHYTEVMQRLYKPIRAQFPEGKTIPPEVQYKVTLQIVAEGLMADWRNMPGADGNELRFTIDNAIQALDDFPEMRDSIVAIASEQSIYLEAAEREVLGN